MYYMNRDGFSIFSTYVEVILLSILVLVRLTYFLHVCGGDPGCQVISISSPVFSPRMWR